MDQTNAVPENVPDNAPDQGRMEQIIEGFGEVTGKLKELDLTGIEPLLPPTYKPGRYART